MRRLLPTSLFLLAAAATTAAEESSGPLSESKQLLQQLQKDQASRTTGTANGDLKGLLPSISAPTLQGQDLPAFTPSAQEQGKNSQATGSKSANWLLDGYNVLGEKSVPTQGKGRQPGHAASGRDEARAGDGAEGHDLLSLYRKQEDQHDSGTTTDKSARTAAVDPMKPFLKSWLANSPVRDAILSARAASDRSEAAADGQDHSAELLKGEDPVLTGQASPSRGPLDLNAGRKDGENPYLQALNSGLSGSGNSVPAATLPTPVQGVGPGLPLPPVQNSATSDAADKSNAFTGPDSKAKDDKKYFPQLKRF
jgi:hypothetical protein